MKRSLGTQFTSLGTHGRLMRLNVDFAIHGRLETIVVDNARC